MSRVQKQDFTRFLSSCEIDRITQLAKELWESEQFRDLNMQQNVFYEQLKKALPAELIPVLIGYCDNNNHMRDIIQKFFYRNGFKDFFIFMQTLTEGRKDIKLDIRIV